MRSAERSKLALHLPAGALDAAERQRMILVDHALGHRGGGERQIEVLDKLPQQRRIAQAHRRRADHGDRPLRRGDQFAGARDRGVRGRRRARAGAASAGTGSLVAAPAPRLPADRDAPGLAAR